jgi:cytochrome c biogenesis protein ResB
MQLSRPAALLGVVSTVTAGGFIGSLVTNHTDANGLWVFLGLLANFLFQLYREHRQRKWVREDMKAKALLEQRVTGNMRTRLSDLSARLDRLVTTETESAIRRRADDDNETD